MEAMGIVRFRGVISQSGVAGVGGAGQFDSNVRTQLNKWWSAGAAFPRADSIACGILRYGRGRPDIQHSGNSQVP
jgi:hypothetical protein